MVVDGGRDEGVGSSYGELHVCRLTDRTRRPRDRNAPTPATPWAKPWSARPARVDGKSRGIGQRTRPVTVVGRCSHGIGQRATATREELVFAGQLPEAELGQPGAGHAMTDVGVGPPQRHPPGEVRGEARQTFVAEGRAGFGQRPRRAGPAEVQPRQHAAFVRHPALIQSAARQLPLATSTPAGTGKARVRIPSTPGRAMLNVERVGRSPERT